MAFQVKIHSLNSDAAEYVDVTSMLFTSPLGIHEILRNHEPLLSMLAQGKFSLLREGNVREDIDVGETGVVMFADNICEIWIIR
jgi:F0F1-type ATP synthase epsilon subunit